MNRLGTLKRFKQKDRYGNSTEYEFNVPEMQEIPNYDHPGEPRGADTVPAWLTPGEAVIPQEAVQAEPELVRNLINKGRSIQEQERGVSIPKLNRGSFIGSPEYFDSLIFKDQIASQYVPYSEDPSLQDYATEYLLSSATEELEDKLVDPLMDKAGSYIPSFFNDGGVAYANVGLINFLKGAEDFRGEAYKDGDGYSIGYGSSGAKEGDTITEEEALARLNKDLEWVNQSYDNSVTNKDLNVNQANAVKSLIYNIGAPNWEKSKAKEALNAGDYDTFEKEMREFRMSGDQVLPGLEKRRDDEMKLFKTSAASDIPQPISKPNLNNKVASNNFGNQDFQFPEGQNLGDRNADVDFEEANTNMFGYTQKDIDDMVNAYASGNATSTEGGMSFDKGQGIFSSTEGGWSPSGDNERDQIDITQQIIEQDKEKAKNKLNKAEQEVINNENYIKAIQGKNDGYYTGPFGNMLDAIILPDSVSQDHVENLEESKKKLEEVQNEYNQVEEKSNKTLEEIKAKIAKRAEVDSALQEFDVDGGSFAEQYPNLVKDPKNNPSLESVITTFGDNKVIDDSDGDNGPANDNISEEKVAQKGAEEDEGYLSELGNSFKRILGDVYNTDELARMALVYAGSVALGYSHQGSLNFAAKNYIKRVDQGLQARGKWILTKDARATYKKDSLEEFRRTGDYDVLEEKDAPERYPVSETDGKKFNKQTNQVLNIVKLDNDREAVFIGGTVNGKKYPAKYRYLDDPVVLALTESYNSGVHDTVKVEKNFQETVNMLKVGLNVRGVGKDAEKITTNDEKHIPNKLIFNQAAFANSLYQDEASRFSADTNTRQELKVQMNEALAEYFDALKAWQNGDRTTQPQSVEIFYRKKLLLNRTEGLIGENELEGTDEANVLALNKLIEARAFKDKDGKQIKDPTKRVQRYKDIWKALDETWKKYSMNNDSGRFINADVDGWNDFTNWARKAIDNNAEANSLFQLTK